jgi:hypothetical protein
MRSTQALSERRERLLKPLDQSLVTPALKYQDALNLRMLNGFPGKVF